MNNEQQNNIGGLTVIDVNKEKLLDVISQNKKIHDDIHNEALEKYQEELESFVERKGEFVSRAVEDLLERFDESCAKFKKEKESASPEYTISFGFSNYLQITEENPDIPVPEPPKSYSSEYDKAMKKIQMSIHDTIRLEERDFNSLVLNEWNWKGDFESTNVNYINRTGCYLSGIAFSHETFK